MLKQLQRQKKKCEMIYKYITSNNQRTTQATTIEKKSENLRSEKEEGGKIFFFRVRKGRGVVAVLKGVKQKKN